MRLRAKDLEYITFEDFHPLEEAPGIQDDLYNYWKREQEEQITKWKQEIREHLQQEIQDAKDEIEAQALIAQLHRESKLESESITFPSEQLEIIKEQEMGIFNRVKGFFDGLTQLNFNLDDPSFAGAFCGGMR
jgi:EAL domain-containing protein (putative c-di-GMP-specific phosphodiesterase class I)